MDRSFPVFISRINEDGANIKIDSRLKQEAENIGLQGKDIAEYVTRQQTLDREERAAWRDTQKRQVEIRMARVTSRREKESRSESHQDPDCSD